MKLTGEIQYSGEKRDFFGGTYYTDISFSLDDVTEEDLQKLHKTAFEQTYFNLLNRALIGFTNVFSTNSRIKRYYSPLFLNRTSLERCPNQKKVNVFIHGPRAEEIDISFRELVPAEVLEDMIMEQEVRGGSE